MTITKICCDHCGKELNDIDDYIEHQIETPLSYINVDLCAACCNELNEKIQEFCSITKKENVEK